MRRFAIAIGRASVGLGVLLGGCGDNALPDGMPLAPADDLVIVAHQDDDLLFMQPDVIEAVQRGGVTSVYVTAGNGTKGTDAADIRYAGLRSAYGEAAHDTDWQCGWIELLGHMAQHCRLAAANVSLVFLAYPDGGKEGEQPNSLLHLWEGTIASAETIADRTATYDQTGIIDVVAEIVRETQPGVIHTLDVASTHGRDHIDHLVVAAIALLAAGRAETRADVISYRGYDIADEPINKIDPVFDATRAILARYEACAAGCGTCGETCTTIDPTHEAWLHRRYAIGFRGHASGRLQSGDRCLTVTDGVATVGDCADAPVWTHDPDGELRSELGCVDVADAGTLVVDACLGGPSRRFFADDEGHVWSAIVPAPQAGMDYAHLRCLTPGASARVAGGGLADPAVRADLCGADVAPVWDFAPAIASTARASIHITATGRAVRLGDLTGDGRADLCTVSPGGLYCAPGDGTGGFSTAIRIDHAATPLGVDPNSLTIGDVDGDGHPDACGRDADGILCALSSNGFATTRFTSTFGDAEARLGTSASLAATDADADGTAEICGLATGGVICASHGATPPRIESSWPDPMSVVWPADLDGDRRADWCATSPAGPSCGVEAEGALTRDGVRWGFALGGVIDDVPADPALAALADIDGDGRADLCSIVDSGSGARVACARSQGRGFGPRATIALFPTATALWLGDLDGDGRADVCVDGGDAILCAVL